jgi:hypothetical protein
MNNCNWKPIRGFGSPQEFGRFCGWLGDQVVLGVATQIPVAHQDSELFYGLRERWFQCKGCNEVWRLLTPDFPFRGSWDELSTV